METDPASELYRIFAHLERAAFHFCQLVYRIDVARRHDASFISHSF